VLKKQMANKFDTLKGKSGWTHVLQPGKFGKWTISVNLDSDSLTKVLAWKKEGIKNELTKDDDGYWVTISRPTYYEDKNKNRIPLAPPLVVNSNNEPFDGTRIGRGSDVEVKVELRDFTAPITKIKAKSMRLVGVKIHNLAAFEGAVDAAPWEERL
jgi:hypothetical protein